MIVKIVNILKANKMLLYLAAFIYSIMHCWYRLSYWRALFSRNCHFKGAFLSNVKFDIGKNKLFVGPRSQMFNCVIAMNGCGHELYIEGMGTCIKNTFFHFIGSCSKCSVANNFSMEGGSISLLEGRCLGVGADCMFSSGIYISVSDFHTIVSLTDGDRINKGKDITIGNHVWLGRDVKVLKGVSIADDSIVGIGSIVTKSLTESNSIYVGAPAKLVKKGVDWNRQH